MEAKEKKLKLNPLEKFWISIMRYNKEKRLEYVFYREIKIKQLEITIEWGSTENLWGRFGGGWNWKIGMQWSRHTLIISLLVLSIRFDIVKTNKLKKEG